jgi:hypothetical protein
MGEANTEEGVTQRRRANRERRFSGLRTIAVGILLVMFFSAYTVGVNLLLRRIMSSDYALILSVAACIGAAVVLAMWAAEGVMEHQTAHVHAHVRSVMRKISEDSVQDKE